ncbi:MAG TPA: SRPBCC domain-containing protein [Gemmatimonadaceae bacterium]
MTTQKDFKRLVRGRMQKTGESYTSARATLLRKRAESNGHAAASVSDRLAATIGASADHAVTAPQTAPADFARRAGMSDEKVKAATGCTWDRWVWALDAVKAYNWPHRDIAQYVHEKYDVPSWWTQTVTVGYERIRGLREKGQRRSGSWEASKSRTIEAAVGTVFKSFKQPKRRKAWLPAAPVIRTAVPNKSLRMTWEDGSSVEVYLTARGRSRSVVAVQHTRLASKQEAERQKAFWAEHLESLASQLQKRGKGSGNRNRRAG